MCWFTALVLEELFAFPALAPLARERFKRSRTA
jgi:hypothetical protein